MTLLQWLCIPVVWFALTGPVWLTGAITDRSLAELAASAGILMAAVGIVWGLSRGAVHG